jgi:hypothetical protein
LFLPRKLPFRYNFYSVIFDEYKGDFSNSFKILFRVKKGEVRVKEDFGPSEKEIVSFGDA